MVTGHQSRPIRIEYSHDLEISHNIMMFSTGKLVKNRSQSIHFGATTSTCRVVWGVSLWPLVAKQAK